MCVAAEVTGTSAAMDSRSNSWATLLNAYSTASWASTRARSSATPSATAEARNADARDFSAAAAVSGFDRDARSSA